MRMPDGETEWDGSRETVMKQHLYLPAKKM